jgi:hypothetical protein
MNNATHPTAEKPFFKHETYGTDLASCVNIMVTSVPTPQGKPAQHSIVQHLVNVPEKFGVLGDLLLIGLTFMLLPSSEG